MKVLITGATGFIGSYIARKMLEDDNIYLTAIKRSTSDLSLIQPVKNKIEWVDCDLSDFLLIHDLVGKADVVIHSAGLVTTSGRNRKQLFKTNIEGTANLINAAIDHSVSRFIHISSVAAFGYSKNEIDETTEWSSEGMKSNYALSKHLGEREAWRGYAEGLNMTIISPSFVLGGSHWNHGPLKMIQFLDQGMKFYPIGSNGIVDVRDMAKMTSEIVQRHDLSGQNIICSGYNISHLDLMNRINAKLGKSPPKIPLKGIIGALSWRMEYVRAAILNENPLFGKEGYKISAGQFRYNNEKSKTLLNFEYLPLEKTISDMIACYKLSRDAGHTFGIFD
jgi:nucleoside-diphosphate-sugar epimerase